ncbi:MAG: hypothetical protein AB1423_14490 [Pseudomonadota bacterium]
MNIRKAIATAALVFSLIFGGLLAFVTSARGQECENPVVSFSFPDTQDIAVTYDRLQMCEDLLKTKDEIIAEQEKNTELLQKANEKLIQALDASEQANAALKQVIEVKKEQEILQAQKCAKDIEKAKPGFFQKLGLVGLGGILGSVATIAGILLL